MDKSILLSGFTDQAIVWLCKLFQERFHSSICLSLDPDNKFWRITCFSSPHVIIMPVLPQLYKLGVNPDLPCTSIILHESFNGVTQTNIPAPGYLLPPKSLITYSELGADLNYDIPGLAYCMLCRCEEVEPSTIHLDNHTRFPSTFSHAHTMGYLHRPVVDEWFSILRSVITNLFPRLPLKEYKFKISLSHDVDRPSAYLYGSNKLFFRNLIGDIMKRKSINTAFDRIFIPMKSRVYFHPKDPFNTFDWLMDVSESLGIHSAFYFMAGCTNPKFDAQYSITDPPITNLMKNIHSRGHEIGLHPSYETYLRPDLIFEEGQRLKSHCSKEGITQTCWGGRMHYLRWKWPTTAYGWQLAGFNYDSSLCYPDRPGFRTGTCHSYTMFDPLEQCTLQLIQRPLVAMECSVIAPRYLGLGYSNNALKLFHHLKSCCKSVGGEFNLLWHNSHFNTLKDKIMYREILT